MAIRLLLYCPLQTEPSDLQAQHSNVNKWGKQKPQSNIRGNVPNHRHDHTSDNNVIFKMFWLYWPTVQIKMKELFQYHSNKSQDAKEHFFCNIENRLAENFTYIGKLWTISPISLSQQRWHLISLKGDFSSLLLWVNKGGRVGVGGRIRGPGSEGVTWISYICLRNPHMHSPRGRCRSHPAFESIHLILFLAQIY